VQTKFLSKTPEVTDHLDDVGINVTIIPESKVVGVVQD
jgi:hypothetical protein